MDNNIIDLKYAHLTRQSDIIPMSALTTPITIIGCGAIGSFTALALAKMGLTNMTVWDHDVVSVENMSCQWYRKFDIGTNKALALKDLIQSFTEEDITGAPFAFDGKAAFMPTGIVINAVDSMATRREIFESIKKFYGVNWYIDPRMGAEDALLYCMNPHEPGDVKAYESTLYSDAGAVQERCTAKSTMYTACLLSGLVAKTVKNLVCKEDYPRVSQWSIKHNDLKSWKREYV